MALASGTDVGPYQILHLLGRGGMGEVYRGRDERLGRDVAIKILPPSYATDPDRMRRFDSVSLTPRPATGPRSCC